MTKEEKSTLTFEDAYARLEQILEKMNSGTASLDESLKLYEEADSLIVSCNKRLSEAEQKIEILIKNRSGELSLNENEKPLTQEFVPSAQSLLNRSTKE
jgi:exodeoxyribonuclease VII small subunit